jgi:trk system potassium uptake protein TrkA
MALFKNKRVLVVGCGRFGSSVAEELASDGMRVTIVDAHADAFDRIDNEFDGEMVIGDGSNTVVLENAGIRNAAAVVCATDSDATNDLIAQIASIIYSVEHVYARIEDESIIETMANLNIEVICPHRACLNELLRLSGMPGEGETRK